MARNPAERLKSDWWSHIKRSKAVTEAQHNSIQQVEASRQISLMLHSDARYMKLTLRM